MSPRQLVRLYESRKSGTFDDQKTPAEIDAGEAVANNHEELFDYLLSQIRQIIGSDHWHSAVPATLSNMLQLGNSFPAVCLATDAVGDCVYARADPILGVYQVTRADPENRATLPALGIISEKSGLTDCRVQYSGTSRGLYGGLQVSDLLFVGATGRLVALPPTPPPGGYAFVQPMGAVLGDDELLVVPSMALVKRIG